MFPTCLAYAIRPSEDRFASVCLQRMGVWGTDAADAAGAQRFHGMDAAFVEGFRGQRNRFWKANYNFWSEKHGFKTGIELVSTQSVAFHYLKYTVFMKRHHAILYRTCPSGTLLGDQLDRIDNKPSET